MLTGSPRESTTSSSRPSSTEHHVSAAMMWLDRKPHDFIRAFKKTKSDSSLLLVKPPRRRGRGESNANDIIEQQQKEDAAKKVKEEREAERRADITRREHSSLVAERVKKAAKLVQLRDLKASIDSDVDAAEGQVGALHDRVNALEREWEELELELAIEEAATPRYQYMLKRTRLNRDAASDQCAAPQREINKILGYVHRCGDSHLSAEFDAKSSGEELGRQMAALRRRGKQNTSSLALLRGEMSDKEESQSAIVDIMARRHDDALRAGGDKSTADEDALRRSASQKNIDTVGASGQRHFTREYALELTKSFQTLSHFFGVQTTEQLVEKVCRFAGCSDSSKAEQLEKDIAAATAKHEGLQEEIRELQAQLEHTRFSGEASNPGYLIFSPRGETLLAFGGSPEVIEGGEMIKDAQKHEESMRSKTQRADNLLTTAAAHMDMLISITQCIADRRTPSAAREAQIAAAREAERRAEDEDSDVSPSKDVLHLRTRRAPLTPEETPAAIEQLCDRLINVAGEDAANHTGTAWPPTTPFTTSQLLMAQQSGLGADFDLEGVRDLLAMAELEPLHVPSWSSRPSTIASRARTPLSEHGVRGLMHSRSAPGGVSTRGSQRSKATPKEGDGRGARRGGALSDAPAAGLLPPVPGASTSAYGAGAAPPMDRGRRVPRAPTSEDVLDVLSYSGLGSPFFAGGGGTGGAASIDSIIQAQMRLRNARDSKNIRIPLQDPTMTFAAVAEEAEEDEDDSRPPTALTDGRDPRAPPSRNSVRSGRHVPGKAGSSPERDGSRSPMRPTSKGGKPGAKSKGGRK